MTNTNRAFGDDGFYSLSGVNDPEYRNVEHEDDDLQ